NELVDKAAGQHRVASLGQVGFCEAGKRHVSHRLHVIETVLASEEGELAAIPTRSDELVVDRAKLVPKRATPPDTLNQPYLLEVRDVSQIPRNGAHQRVVDGVHGLVRKRLDQLEGSPARVIKQFDKSLLKGHRACP